MPKTSQFQAIQFSPTVLIQILQFSIITVFVHLPLNVKTVLFQMIHFSVSTQFKCPNSSILNNPVKHKYALLCKNSKHSKSWFNSSWPIDRILSGATTPFNVISRTLVGGILLLSRDAVRAFYSSSWLDKFSLVSSIFIVFLKNSF